MRQVLAFAAVFWVGIFILAAALYDPNQIRATHQIRMVVPVEAHPAGEPDDLKGEES